MSVVPVCRALSRASLVRLALYLCALMACLAVIVSICFFARCMVLRFASVMEVGFIFVHM